MPAQLARRLRKHRADREIAQFGTDRGGGLGHRVLDFLAGQMLAEGRQRIGQPPRYQQTRRIAADKANRVAKDKTPQPGAGAEHRGVFDPGLDLADRMPRRRRRIDLADRHELIKNAVIENDAHAPRRVRDRRRR